jgi:hypothetical protein
MVVWGCEMVPLELKILLGEAAVPPQSERPQTLSMPTLRDWLTFNHLTSDIVARRLALITQPKPPHAAAAEAFASRLALSAEEAWSECAASLRAAFPDLAQDVATVEATARQCFQPKRAKHPKPFTYDLGQGECPFVSLHYQHRIADLLAMAHEFGHVVQIVASGRAEKAQMPPVARECCAFLAELALVRRGRAHFAGLMAAHLADDAVYFGENRQSLEDALGSPCRPYAYDWNYPLARHVAAHLFEHGTPHTAATLFRAGQGGGTLFASLADPIDKKGLAA